MKSNSKSKYSEISSFKDFRIEKEQLNFRNELIEAKLKLTYLKVTEKFSVSNLFTSLARDIVLPKISDFLGGVINKAEKDTHSEGDSSQSEAENSQQE